MSELMAPQEGDKEAIQAPIQPNPAAESPKVSMGMGTHPGIPGVPNSSQPPPGIGTNQTFDFGMNQTPGVGPPTPNNPPNQGAPPNSQSASSIPTSGSGPGIPDGIPEQITGNPVPNPMNVPMSGMGPMPTSLGPNQPNQSPQQPQKSHLAEILGSHEMAQLKTMSRSTSDYTNNASQNPNPGGMGPGIGPPNTMQPGGQIPNRPTNPAMMSGMNHPYPNPNMHPGLHPAFMNSVPPGTQAGMPANFRFNTPNPVRNVNPNYPEGTQRIGSQTDYDKNTYTRDLKNRDLYPENSPSSNTPPGEANGKTGGKRPRRPSRKNSQDGDTEPKRQRKRKGENADGTGKRGKRKGKNPVGGVQEGQLYMFSTQMLNEAAESVSKKKSPTMVNYHQISHGGPNPVRITAVLKNTPSTTPPIPSGTSPGMLPGHPRPPMPHRQNSPAPGMGGIPSHAESPAAMSPLSNVMSPLGPRGLVGPGRVPTPQGTPCSIPPTDGRLTPGSGTGGPTMRPGMGPGGIGMPLSPAHSQDSRIPTPNAHSPATAPSPSPSNPSSNTPGPPGIGGPPGMPPQSQEEKIKNIADIREKFMGTQATPTGANLRNPTPEGMTTMDTLRQSEKRQNGPMNAQGSQGTPENPSPGPQNGQNPPHAMNAQSEQDIQKIIMLQQQRQKQQAAQNMMSGGMHPHMRYPPYMQHPGMNSMMMNRNSGYGGMRPGSGPGGMRYPGMPSQYDHPAMRSHPAMPGYHPSMGMGPRGHPMMPSRFPPNDPRIRPGGMYFSEQLRQQAAPYISRPEMSPFSGQPGFQGQPAGQPNPMMGGQNEPTQNGPTPGQPNFNQPSGPTGQPGPPQSQPPGPQQPNGDFLADYDNSFTINAQNGPPSGQGMMSPMSNPPMPTNGPMGTPNGPVGAQLANGPTPNGPSTPGPPIGQNPANPAVNNANQDSPYPNSAKSPAGSQLNGPIPSPSPSQGGPPSIAPSVPEMHPLTPQGAQQPNSPACNAPMTPISHHGGPNTPGGPVTPGGEFANAQNPQGAQPPQNAPMTPLTNPLTPGGNPNTPGPATPVAPTNPLADPEAPLSNQNMPPCSPMTPQGQNMGQQGFPNRPDAPLTPSTPNGPQMNGPNGPAPSKMGILPDGFDLSQIIPPDQGMGNTGGQPQMHPGTQNHPYNSYGGPRMGHPGLHAGGHPGAMGMGMGTRMGMMGGHQQMGMMTTPQMTPTPHPYGQWSYGPGGGPRY